MSGDNPTEEYSIALARINDTLKDYDSLDVLHEIYAIEERKKQNSMEKLRVGVRAQLDGIKTTMQLINLARDETAALGESMKAINESLHTCSQLTSRINLLKSKASDHSQRLSARENFVHITEVPNTAEEIRGLLRNGELLRAHKVFAQLENARDDLLVELHKNRQDAGYEHNVKTIYDYFQCIDELAEKLKAASIHAYIPNVIVKAEFQPHAVVSVLRIVEREEKKDRLCFEEQTRTGIVIKNRPRKWSEEVKALIREFIVDSVFNVFGSYINDHPALSLRDCIKETTTLAIQIYKVKQYVVKCFPPHYDIFNSVVKWTHIEIQKHLEEISNFLVQLDLILDENLSDVEFSTLQSVKNDLFLLYTFSNKAYNEEFLGQFNLGYSFILLDDFILKKIEEKYIIVFERCLKQMACKSIDLFEKLELVNVKRDFNAQLPEVKTVGNKLTSVLPSDLYQLFLGQIGPHKSLRPEFFTKVCGVIANMYAQVAVLIEPLLNSFQRFFQSKLKDADEVEEWNYFYIRRIILLVNITTVLSSHVDESFRTELNNVLRTHHSEEIPFSDTLRIALTNNKNLANKCIVMLYELIAKDLKESYEKLFTQEWIESEENVFGCTLWDTLQDYMRHDLYLMDREYQCAFVVKCWKEFALQYIIALLKIKIPLRTLSERTAFAEKCKEEVNHLSRNLINEVASFSNSNFKSTIESERYDPLQFIVKISEIYECKDVSEVYLVLPSLLSCFPDVPHSILVRLIDYPKLFPNKSAVKTLVENSAKNAKLIEGGSENTIFTSDALTFKAYL